MIENDRAQATRAAFDAAAADYAERFERSDDHQHIILPSMLRLAGDVAGRAVLCLGYGAGGELELLRDAGAHRLVGVDLSPEMQRLADARVPEAHVVAGDLMTFDPRDERFDLVWAALSLQYVDDLAGALERCAGWLHPGGRLLLTLPHPIYFGASRLDHPGGRGQRRVLGYNVWRTDVVDSDQIECFGDYLTIREAPQRLAKSVDVTFWLRPVSEVVTAVLASPLTLVALEEPKPRAPQDGDPAALRRFLVGMRSVPLTIAVAAELPR